MFMKQWILTLICLSAFEFSDAQTFLGLYGNENCVTQIKDNPAYAVTEDRAQINFVTAGINVGSNGIFFRKSVFNFLSNGQATMDKDYYRNYDKHDKSIWGNMEIVGPGASFLVKKRWFFAVTTGMRYLMNMNNLDNNVYRLMGLNPTHTDTLQVDSFKVKNFAITSQVFSELNLTYAGYIYQSEDRALVAGAGVKILNGIAAAGLGIANGSFKTYNNDGVAHNAYGDVNVALTPYANKWAITNNPFKALGMPANNLGIGADVGFVYYMNPNETMYRKVGYTNRISVSITDIGSISYTASSVSGRYDISNKNIDYRHIQNNPDGSFGTYIFNNFIADTVAKATGSAKRVKFGLPTALHINGDFKVQPRIYVNANVLVNLRTPDPINLSSHYITTFTVTPRYQTKKFAVSMPFSFNMENQGYMGLIVFAGPVYVGSGSLLQMTISNSINSINFFAGASLRIKPKKPKERDYMMM